MDQLTEIVCESTSAVVGYGSGGYGGGYRSGGGSGGSGSGGSDSSDEDNSNGGGGGGKLLLQTKNQSDNSYLHFLNLTFVIY